MKKILQLISMIGLIFLVACTTNNIKEEKWIIKTFLDLLKDPVPSPPIVITTPPVVITTPPIVITTPPVVITPPTIPNTSLTLNEFCYGADLSWAPTSPATNVKYKVVKSNTVTDIDTYQNANTNGTLLDITKEWITETNLTFKEQSIGTIYITIIVQYYDETSMEYKLLESKYETKSYTSQHYVDTKDGNISFCQQNRVVQKCTYGQNFNTLTNECVDCSIAQTDKYGLACDGFGIKVPYCSSNDHSCDALDNGLYVLNGNGDSKAYQICNEYGMKVPNQEEYQNYFYPSSFLNLFNKGTKFCDSRTIGNCTNVLYWSSISNNNSSFSWFDFLNGQASSFAHYIEDGTFVGTNANDNKTNLRYLRCLRVGVRTQ